jgi:hypothetical protein
VPRPGEALVWSGLAALLYWSPTMRAFRLDPADIEDITAAYERLLRHPAVDQTRSGLLGTGVGGSFALMAVAQPRIRARVFILVAYVLSFSIWSLVRAIASATQSRDGRRESWAVHPLTRKVSVHSVTALLEPAEAEQLPAASEVSSEQLDGGDNLTEDGRVVASLLGTLSLDQAEVALRQLSAVMAERLSAMSPASYLKEIWAPLIVLCHDRDGGVIPVSKSRRLRVALAGRAGVHYTEFTVYQHLDRTRGRPALLPLLRELLREFARFALAVYPVFRRIVASVAGSRPPRLVDSILATAGALNACRTEGCPMPAQR